MLNLPLIADTLAVRAVVYNDRRGGYIDNVPATFTRKNTDLGIHYANFPAVSGGARTACRTAAPACRPAARRHQQRRFVTGRAINPVTYQGMRVSALYKINDDWNALITQSYQNMDSEGVFYQQPSTPPTARRCSRVR